MWALFINSVPVLCKEIVILYDQIDLSSNPRNPCSTMEHRNQKIGKYLILLTGFSMFQFCILSLSENHSSSQGSFLFTWGRNWECQKFMMFNFSPTQYPLQLYTSPCFSTFRLFIKRNDRVIHLGIITLQKEIRCTSYLETRYQN